MASTQSAPVSLPRVAITYCTQCRWMLRAAYFGQELLSTFGTQIGEIALIPATGGLFTVKLTYRLEDEDCEIKEVLLWDRKAEGGFPETRVLKQRLRDHIDPNRDLGHSDRHGKKKAESQPTHTTADAQVDEAPSTTEQREAGNKDCQDCS
ncbi:seleno protein W family protein [Sporormia fimetaria CBS 119925]|uniref:Seleno protein W family protein n=1 Tax=Sporormia fimetaria CBS 119925 TaxID=1340428 RepID=A0A6A6VQP2_9PLEO|nr:seleno protein W family protein [Sporormia fimetaria CBS 119925]